MIDDEKLKQLEAMYFQNGFDVPYELKKGGEILIKPILVKDYSQYENSIPILQIPKNEINDIKVIQMSYLEFLINVTFVQDKSLIGCLSNLMSLCLGEEKVAIGKDKGKDCIIILDDEEKISKIINSKEFDDISKIILNQNDSNYDNRYISPDVRKAYEEYCQLKYKNINSPSLEKRKAFVISKIGYKIDEVNEMIYRVFSLVYSSCVDSEIYIGDKIIQGSEKFKCDDVKHPQFEKKKDPITEMFGDAEAFENKIQQANG